MCVETPTESAKAAALRGRTVPAFAAGATAARPRTAARRTARNGRIPPCVGACGAWTSAPRVLVDGCASRPPYASAPPGRPMARLVLVHDYLLVLRGAERTFAAMADAWPRADVVTLLFDEEAMAGRFAGHAVTTSPLQRLGADQRRFRALLPVLGPAARRLPTDDADRIVSSSSAFAHGVRKRPGAVHVCYCHSPFRYAWHEQARARSEVPRALRGMLEVLLRRHRAFDRRAAAGVDRYIANGRLTQERIRRFWGRGADLLHPPVDVGRF